GNHINSLATSRLQLFAGAFSEIELISSHAKISGADTWINQRFDVSLEENAHVRYVQLNHHASSDVWHFDAVRGTLKKSSSLTCVNVSNGSATVRNDYRVSLSGENCETSLNGVWMLKERREAHQHIFIDHQAPHCFSRQLFKGALKDTSHSSFEGKIVVRQEAQETNAFQLNNNLLLNEGATAESKPNLEIFADNVKASHGATIGQLEKEELFYMQSRGFSSEEAKQLLVHGFCQDVLGLIRQEEIRQRVAVQLFK
ncbi:MAG: Fe-S cluster assembly protein SufD, partial [Parachlamydiaceae bacterium]